MSNCKRRTSLPWLACLALAGVAVPQTSLAQLPRSFPATALRGYMAFSAPPVVQINEQTARLSPGVRLLDRNNMMMVPAVFSGQSFTVNYTLDMAGNVHQVWLLRDEEAARQPWPQTVYEAQTWQFDAYSQTWTVR